MKNPRRSYRSKPSKRMLRAVVNGLGSSTGAEVRPEMMAIGARLISDPDYPNEKVVTKLAQLFATQIFAERN